MSKHKLVMTKTKKPHKVRLTQTDRTVVYAEPTEEGVMKVTEEFISDLRSLAKKQKAESSANEFVKILGNNGKDVPKPTTEEFQINLLAEDFEIEEE